MTTRAIATLNLQHWRWEQDESGIGWLAIDKSESGTNVLSRAVMQELEAVLGAIEAATPRGLVIYSAKPGNFIAGADIHEFPTIRSVDDALQLCRRGQGILERVENLSCPTVAVINGSALGGGLEFALACTWRIGLPYDQPCLGFPEVQLGLHPGFGGTVRAVGLLGVRRAMELMLTGRSVTMTDGLRYGLIDGISSEEGWRRDAATFLSRPRPRRAVPALDRLLALRLVRGSVARSLERQAARKARPEHYPAPFAMIKLWREHAGCGRAAYDAEAQSFAQLVATDTSRNLVRVFFLQDRLKRAAGRRGSPARRVHIVGAGLMGGDIAAWCALRGLTVTLQDRDIKYVEPALGRAEKLFAKRLSTEKARQSARSRLTADVQGEGVTDADVVIEAIFEDLRAKQDLYRSLEPRIRSDAVLATNTSSIPLEDLMTALRNPSRLIGLHFFNPVARLPLVEVVRTGATSQEALDAGLAFTRHIGKLPLPCRSHPGFLVNRILAPYLAEAMQLAQEGIPLPDIDDAATAFGMPMGPVELADTVGLDIALHVARILSPLLGRQVTPELERLVNEGHLGQKTGRGFYVYQHGRAVKPHAGGRPVRENVQERLILALLNEAAHCLAEEIVADADLVDAGVIFGTGFAPFRGGPLHYAAQQGIDNIVKRLAELNATLGERFRPSPGWNKLRGM